MTDKANLAHKSAKSLGKSTVLWYDEDLLKRLREAKVLNGHMKLGLERGEFKMFLQPKFNVQEMRVVGAEALVRWDYPDYGLVYPDSLISLFEKNGTIYDLDFYMLRKVCTHIRARMDAGKEVLPISVNFSRATLYHKNFDETFISIVREYQIPCSYIELEITEGAFNGITDSMMLELIRIREAGFLISMDDFGSGYSSLNLLTTLPIQVVKLDRDFLKEFSVSEKAQGVISCVVELAHVLNMKVVCEGVETQEHVNF